MNNAFLLIEFFFFQKVTQRKQFYHFSLLNSVCIVFIYKPPIVRNPKIQVFEKNAPDEKGLDLLFVQCYLISMGSFLIVLLVKLQIFRSSIQKKGISFKILQSNPVTYQQTDLKGTRLRQFLQIKKCIVEVIQVFEKSLKYDSSDHKSLKRVYSSQNTRITSLHYLSCFFSENGDKQKGVSIFQNQQIKIMIIQLFNGTEPFDETLNQQKK